MLPASNKRDEADVSLGYMKWFIVSFFLLGSVQAQSVLLPSDPALSPDGKTLVFAWAGRNG